jgi:FlaA1/EpsC-like NDP-sugar epimerase
MAFFSDKKVLLIGGTGTIGRGVLQTLLKQDPKVVRVLSRDEFKQFQLQDEYKSIRNIRYLLGDVRDYNRVLKAMEDIDVVFHFAALKHVPACEYNPFEAVQTNILGTQNVVTAAINAGVERVIVTSSDKAISPTNTYGATKLVVERLIAAAEVSKGSSKTVFSAVRFGNVLGSRGSVIPLLKQQILARHALTITNPDMTRFMMTQSQAVDLTLQAAERANGGELFILKMPVIKLGTLIDVLEREVCQKYEVAPPSREIIGLRPGEKMFEELMTREESTQAIELPDMFVIPPFQSDRPYEYDNARSAREGSYSSNDTEPITDVQLSSWLHTENLI